MPLPSQTARAGSQTGRTNMFRRRRPGAKPLLAAGVLVVLGLGVWGLAKMISPRPDAGGSGPLGPSSASAASPPAPFSEPKSAPAKLLATDTPPPGVAAPKPADPPLVEVRQGRSGDSETGSQPGRSGTKPQVPLGHTPGAPAETVVVKSPSPAPSNPVPPAPNRVSAPAAAAPASPAGTGLNISAPADLAPALASARQKLAGGDPVGARQLYAQALRDERLSDSDKGALRDELTRINEDLVFSPRVTPSDPFADTYVVQGGDNLTVITRRLGLGPDRRLITRINRLSNPDRLTVGQKLKVLKGPFHAVVSKAAFRLDLYMGPTDQPQQWVYVRSFRVGLGEQGSTPVGTFRSKKGSKLVDPPWINPRTGEKFAGGDSKNPIGKFWVGLEGLGESAQYTGYGIHGTIEPDSIGQQKSMGCVRMLADDIALVFELMGEQVSTVKIEP